MNGDLLLTALLTGAATWCFRALPTIFLTSEPKAGGWFARFLASTGPAAIATLFVASVLSQLYPQPRDLLPLFAGVAVTVLAFLPRRSVVGATLAGALAYGLAFSVVPA